MRRALVEYANLRRELMMEDGSQLQRWIHAAMTALAHRKPGKSRLVYDKTRRTIVEVKDGEHRPLSITLEEANLD